MLVEGRRPRPGEDVLDPALDDALAARDEVVAGGSFAAAVAPVVVGLGGLLVASPVTGDTFATARAVFFAASRDEDAALVVRLATFVVASLAAPRVAAFAEVDRLVEDTLTGALVAAPSESIPARRAASAARVAAGSGSNVRVRGACVVGAGWVGASARACARARADPGIGWRGSSRSWMTGATIRMTSSSLAEASGSRRTP